MRNRNSQKGQVLLIVTLTMIVALTVGLSLISRSLTNLKISKQNEESQRAFSAAEAGIERALKQTGGGTVTGDFSNNNAAFTTSINEEEGPAIALNGEDAVPQNIGIDVWLAEHPNFANPYNGTVTIYWATSSQHNNCGEGLGVSATPALEVLVLSGPVANPVLNKYFYDFAGCIASRNNGAQNASVGGPPPPPEAGGPYQYRVTIPPAGTINNGLIMKVVPVYNSTIIGVTGSGDDFPTQGSTIVSSGTSGDTTRRIEVFNTLPQIPPEMFQYAILSQ